MDGPRVSPFRAAMTLGVLAVFGAGMLISNAGAVAEKKEASKKFVKQRVAKAVGGLEAQLDQELVRFSAKMNVGDANRPVATIGPLTWTARCVEQPAGDITAELQISTSQNNSSFSAYDGDQDDFDIAESPATWLGPDSGDPIDGPDPSVYTNGYYAVGAAGGADGTTVTGGSMIFTNLAGFDCVIQGFFVRTS